MIRERRAEVLGAKFPETESGSERPGISADWPEEPRTIVWKDSYGGVMVDSRSSILPRALAPQPVTTSDGSGITEPDR
ncbi:hypothetical protein RU639_003492 [Aspergillus parasiticus]